MMTWAFTFIDYLNLRFQETLLVFLTVVVPLLVLKAIQYAYEYFTKQKSKKLLILDMNNVLVYRAFKYKQEADQPQTVQYNGTATLLGGRT